MVLLLIVVNNIFITIFGDRGNEIHLHICNSWKLAQCSKLRKKQIHPRWNVFSTILDNANGTCDLFNRIMIIVEICLALYWLQELQIFTGWIILLNAQSSFNTSFKKKKDPTCTLTKEIILVVRVFVKKFSHIALTLQFQDLSRVY